MKRENPIHHHKIQIIQFMIRLGTLIGTGTGAYIVARLSTYPKSVPILVGAIFGGTSTYLTGLLTRHYYKIHVCSPPAPIVNTSAPPKPKWVIIITPPSPKKEPPVAASENSIIQFANCFK